MEKDEKRKKKRKRKKNKQFVMNDPSRLGGTQI
jgi:hypothetical protein